MNLRISILGIALAMVAGCATPPPSQSPPEAVKSPDTFLSAPTNATAPAPWLASFNDKTLTALVKEAQEHNQNLQVAAARLQSARAELRIAGADRLPSVTANFGASRTKRTSTSGFQLASSRTDRFDLGGTFMWEADLWGRYLNREKAAVAGYEAAQADFRAAQLSLAVSTAKAWFTAVELNRQVQLAQNTALSFQTNLNVIEGSFNRGIATALDVRLSRANVASARSNVELRERQRDAAVRSLEVILGRYPADQLDVIPDLPPPPSAVPAGLPADLLTRRPDIIAAERRLAARHQQLKASKKALLPNISLTATGGTTSDELKDLLDTRNLIWSLAGNLAQPIFQGGRIRGDIALSKARKDEAIATFAQSLLVAFQEVETTLAAESFLTSQSSSLETAVLESQAAEALAWKSYQNGLSDIITVLESQRRSFTVQSSLIALNNLRLQNRLDLYLALGGEFESPNSSTPAP